MKLQKIILAAAAAAVLALSASCRATGEDGGGGGDGGPAALNIVFDPNGGYWLNSDDPDDKSDTAARSTTQIVGRLITPPALSETESETPLPLYLDWEGQQRRSNLYQFVGWYQLPEGETTPPARIQLGEEVPQDLIARVVSTDTIVDVDALLPGYNTVTGELSQVTLYALWLEPPECYRVSFYKFFNGTDPQELIGTPVELQEGNSGLSQSQIPSGVSRTHYNKNSDNWYKVLDDGTVSDTAFDFSAEVTDSHKLVMKWTGITYQISFKPNGGTPAPSVVQIQYPTPVAASNIPTVTRTYYDFGGWYKTNAQITDANKLTVGSLITANTEYTANWTPAATYYLESLSVVYAGQATAITPAFAPGTQNYSATGTAVTGNVTITAKAIDPNAKITIILKGTSNTVLTAETASGSSGVSGTTSVPTVTLPQKTIQIQVKNTLNFIQNYEIDLTLNQGAKDVWSGTVNNKLNGGTASDGKTISQLIAFNADRSIKGIATLGSGTDSRTWTMETYSYQGFRPQTFIVYFSEDDDKSVSDEITPAGAPLAPAAGIVINATKAGIRLSDANEFLQLGDPANVDKDFALGGDIDLTNTEAAWDGPTNYSGHFYGNGYTIKGLVLSGGNGNIALFRGLGDGAVIENFALEAYTSGVYNTASLEFGGVVGYISTSGTRTIRNVKLTGDFEFGNITSSYLVIGGIVAEIGDGARQLTGSTTIENCSVDLSVVINSSNTATNRNNIITLGGILSSARATVDISNCRANVNFQANLANDQKVYAGGIVGMRAIYSELSISNCYSEGEIVVNNNARTAFYSPDCDIFVGGIIGGRRFNEAARTFNMQNCATLVKRVLAIVPAGYETNAYVDRVYGGNNTSGSNGTWTLSNNYALNNMRTGKTDATYPGASVDGDATGFAGLGKTEANFKTESTWTTGLGWSADIWDFDGLNKSGADFYWPRLK